MSEYIIRETGYPGAVKQEVVCELIRCKDCKHGQYDFMLNHYWCNGKAYTATWFCAGGERRE